MARLRRIQPPDIALHIVIRGNDRQAIFRGDGDRIFFHRCLVETSRREQLAIHAYVLMSNHVHLLATPRIALAASRTMQSLGRRYVAYFNRIHQRTGTLWEGRFRSAPVASDEHFLACQRYIEMNPVRARMIATPDQCIWSSHRHHLGLAADDLVTPHSLVVALSSSAPRRAVQYRRLFDHAMNEGMVERIRDCLNNGWALGDDAWCESLESFAGRRVRRIGPPRTRGVERALRAAREHSDPKPASTLTPNGMRGNAGRQEAGQGTARSWEPA